MGLSTTPCIARVLCLSAMINTKKSAAIWQISWHTERTQHISITGCLKRASPQCEHLKKVHGIMRSHGKDKSTPETYPANPQVDEDTTGCKPSDPATSSLTKWSPWKEDSLQAIRTLFQEEIAVKRISIDESSSLPVQRRS